MFRKLIFILLMLASIFSVGQSSYTPAIYRAFVDGDMTAWKRIIIEMNQNRQHFDQPDLWYEMGLLKYGYIAWCIDQEKKEEASEMIEEVEDDIEQMLDMNPEWSSVYALWGAIYAFRIQLKPAKAIYLGPRSMKRIEKCLEIDPDDPHGWLEMANSEFYRPAVFGGDKQKAIESYKKSIAFFEADKALVEENWHYLNVLISLAKAYEEIDDRAEAGALYEKILDIEPDFIWVRDDLYPALLKTE